ncbi:RNA polymerase sigma-70 factor [Parapedobacter sp. ISTM3]|uniref:RNA polymerase sigma factor n=1 Tax=Parapedobacter sp. ISTM3 TaxID=2800130 RepID=UPI001906AB5A|nr:RNA polymerase sigma-70 factor [Parapedobacter sp. ISTM3]MBK1439478.1 RNA polymerase sigma-70 factor [Parapedobacter sp. ISTM3]
MAKEKDRIRLRQLKAGDESVFSEIYDAHWESLFKYVIRILPDQDDAADIVQETFVTFWELRRQLDGVKTVKAYLFVMARNLAFRRFRDYVKRTEVEDKLAQFYGDPVVNLEQLVGAKELANLLDAEIEKLPKRMREVFVLSRKEHLSYKEIAERLHISDQTVKKQINNSLKYLRLKIDEEYIPYLMLLVIIDKLT